MFRHTVLLLIGCLLGRYCLSQNIDLTICPNGLTQGLSDPQWPTTISNRFEIFAEVSTSAETFEVTQTFVGPYQDRVQYHTYESDLQTYYDFQNNEMLIINAESQCDRFVVQQSESLPFVTSQILKPSVLLGFDGRNNLRNDFAVTYVGKTVIRDGIETKNFQSCFYLAEENLTLNVTYFIAEPKPPQTTLTTDFVRIEVLSNNFPYIFEIIRLKMNPSTTITTPAGVFCEGRSSSQELPSNIPSKIFFHAETFNLKNADIPARVESYNRLIDEDLQIERNDFSLGNNIRPSPPTAALIDYATGLSYLYTRPSDQCMAMNISREAMGSSSNILFQFDNNNDDLKGIQYTGIVDCGREYVQCHRWIIQRDLQTFIQQYEWYWSARFHHVDLDESMPMQLNMERYQKIGPEKRTKQEINFYNFSPSPDSMQMIDETLGRCYRALGPNQNFNYAILRFTLNNDAQAPVHRFVLSLQYRVHMQLASDLKIRHLRLSSFSIDTTRDTIDGENKNVYVTFTLLDNPPGSIDTLKEEPLIDLIRQLTVQIDHGLFHVRDEIGGFQLQARPKSLQTLVLYRLPTDNQTIFIYQNFNETIYRDIQKVVKRSSGPQIAAFWTGFALLGLVVTLGIGTFIAIRKWTPVVN